MHSPRSTRSPMSASPRSIAISGRPRTSRPSSASSAVTKTDQRTTDLEHMAAALSLAARNLGQTWPNPAVGCVIVDAAGHVVGRGFTQRGGRPHAETEALKMAGERARGGTAYVTLEPCSHHGKTLPCAEALVAAGIKRCVAAIEHPDPSVAGRGFAKLAAWGSPGRRHQGAADGRAEAGDLSGRPDCHPGGRKPLDHGGGGAGLRTSI